MDASSYSDKDLSYKKPGKREQHVKMIFSCNECDIQCHGKPAFNRHLKLHITLKCPACGKVYKDRHLFRRHVNDHEKRFECSECATRFSRLTTLNTHVLSQHHNEGTIWNNEIKRAKLEETNGCIDQCRNIFMSLLQKQSKNKIVIKEFANFEERIGNYRSAFKLTELLTNDTKLRHVCGSCTFQASSKSYLEKHTKLWHQTKAKCKKCLKEYENKFSLQKYHDDCTGYKCEVMECMFTSKFAAWMKKHKLKHVE